MSESDTKPSPWQAAQMDEDTTYELCPICNDEDTQIPPCAWCDGLGYIEHDCPTPGTSGFPG